MSDTVLAAGGVLWRPAGDGVELCLVHRPRYDDWSLPKGKLDKAEHPLVAAVREVREETGVGGRPQLRLPPVEYTLPDGRAKAVEFWLMRATGPGRPHEDTDEVDRIEWLPLAAVPGRLSYPDEVRLVEHVAAQPPVTAVQLLARHALAGKRSEWDGEDALRPLDDEGLAQAAALGPVLALFAPERLYAATPLRCRQTLQPLAEELGLPIVTDSAFAEPAAAADAPAKAKVGAARLVELRPGPPVAVCSQGKVIPEMLAELSNSDDPKAYKTPKGGAWALTWSGDRLLGLSRL